MSKKQFVLYVVVTLVFLSLLDCAKWLIPSDAISASGAKEIRANSFILVDNKGRQVGGLLAQNGLVLLRIGSEKGNSVEISASSKSGCAAFFMDEKGNARLKMGLSYSGDASLQLNHFNNKLAIGLLALKENKMGAVNIKSPSSKSEVVIMSKQEASAVGLVGRAGVTRGTFMCSPKTGAGMSIINNKGRGQITAVVSDSGENKMVIQNSKNNEILIAGVGERGAQLRIHNRGNSPEGNVTIGLLGKAPWLDLTGPNGKKIVSILSDKEDHLMRIFDKGKPIWQLPN